MRRILIFYSHFSPAFKAGGPVQSLVNLVERLKDEYKFFIVCSAFEIGETQPLPGIIPGEWNTYGANIQVYYVKSPARSVMKKVFEESNPDVVYVNGMYLPFYNVLPIWYAKKSKIKIVVAPRGMLQRGALAIKPFKKQVFLKFFKLFRLHKDVVWHSTDEQERKDILSLFGENANVELAGNIPKAPYPELIKRKKGPGELKLIYLSLITEKKNLHLVLSSLRKIPIPITFDIFGPIKDHAYWERCKALISGQIHTIRYAGIVVPHDVQKTFIQYHALILPTKGENFGHAIYEALSVGTPAIISQFTPWANLQANRAGITVDLEDEAKWSEAIDRFIASDQSEFDLLSRGAYELSTAYYSTNDFKSAYLNLFK